MNDSSTNHDIKRTNFNTEPLDASSSSDMLDLTIEHLQLLKRRKLHRRWKAIYPLLFMIFIFASINPFDTPSSILLRYIFFVSMFIFMILTGGLLLYYVISELLMRASLESIRWLIILREHKQFDPSWFNINLLFIYAGLIPGYIIMDFMRSKAFFFFLWSSPLWKLFLDTPNLRYPLWGSLLLFSLFIAMRQLVGEHYPYVRAFYSIRRWYEANEREEQQMIQYFVNGFRDLERDFGLNGLSFGEFRTKFIEGILFLTPFGSSADKEEFLNNIFTLLKEMQRLDNLKLQNYHPILAVIARMNEQLNSLDFREYMQKKRSRLERLKSYLLQPALIGRFITYLFQTIPYVLLAILAILLG